MPLCDSALVAALISKKILTVWLVQRVCMQAFAELAMELKRKRRRAIDQSH